MASDEDLTMIRKFWARSFLVVALFGAAMPVSAAEITSPAKQAHITDFKTGKVLFSKNADAPMKPAKARRAAGHFNPAATHRGVVA